MIIGSYRLSYLTAQSVLWIRLTLSFEYARTNVTMHIFIRFSMFPDESSRDQVWFRMKIVLLTHWFANIWVRLSFRTLNRFDLIVPLLDIQSSFIFSKPTKPSQVEIDTLFALYTTCNDWFMISELSNFLNTINLLNFPRFTPSPSSSSNFSPCASCNRNHLDFSWAFVSIFPEKFLRKYLKSEKRLSHLSHRAGSC